MRLVLDRGVENQRQQQAGQRGPRTGEHEEPRGHAGHRVKQEPSAFVHAREDDRRQEERGAVLALAIGVHGPREAVVGVAEMKCLLADFRGHPNHDARQGAQQYQHEHVADCHAIGGGQGRQGDRHERRHSPGGESPVVRPEDTGHGPGEEEDEQGPQEVLARMPWRWPINSATTPQAPSISEPTRCMPVPSVKYVADSSAVP